MSRQPPRPQMPAVSSQRTTPREGLVAAVAAAIARADAQRPYGAYDYSSYPGDAPPYAVRDERTGRDILRTWDHAEGQAAYKRLTEEFVAEAALTATAEWYTAHRGDLPMPGLIPFTGASVSDILRTP